MNKVGSRRPVLVTIFVLVSVLGCSPAAAPPSPNSPASYSPLAESPLPKSSPTRAGASSIDYVALEAEIEKAISTGPVTLDNVQAVLVNVDGETAIAHYRHGFTEGNYGHVWSVTKSVISILIGIAIEDGLIADLDTPLAKLLPSIAEP